MSNGLLRGKISTSMPYKGYLSECGGLGSLSIEFKQKWFLAMLKRITYSFGIPFSLSKAMKKYTK